MPGRRTVFIAIFLVLALIGAYSWAPQWLIGSRVQAASLKDIFIKRLEEEYPIQVTCGSLQFKGGKIELRDLLVKTTDKKLLMRVPLTSAGLDLWNLLLHPTSFKNAVTRLDMTNPVIYLSRDANGRWNVEPFTHLKKKKGMDLKIGVENGRLELPKDISGWQPGTLYGINGDLNLQKNRQMNWHLVGRTSKEKQIVVVADGSVTPAKTNGRIQFRAENVPLTLLENEPKLDAMLSKWGISGLTGQCSVELKMAQSKKGWSWDGIACQLDDVGGRWAKLAAPVTGLSGQVRIFPEYIRADALKGNIGQAPLRLDGEAAFPGGDTRREMNIFINGFDLSALKPLHPAVAAWNAQGQADIRLRFSGSFKDPRFRGEVHLTNGSGRVPSQGLRISGLESLAVLTDDGIQLRYLKGSLEDSRFEADGMLRDWKDFHWDLHLKTERFSPNKLWAKIPLQVEDLQGEASVTGSLTQPVIQWKAGTDRVTWNQWTGRDLNADGRYEFRTGRLTVDHFHLGLGKAIIEGQGGSETRGENPQFNAELKGTSVDLTELSSILALDGLKGKLSPLSGVVSFNLSGKGRIKDWKTWDIQGELQGADGEIPTVRFQRLSGRFRLTAGKVRVERFLLEQSAGRLQADGEWSPGNGFAGRVEADNLWMETVLTGKTSRKVAGSLSGQVDVSGSQSVSSYNGGGHLEINRLSVDGEILGNLRLAAVYKDSLFHLDGSSLDLQSGGKVAINGTVGLTGQTPQMDIGIHSDDLTLAAIEKWLSMRMPLKMEGSLQTDLHLTGTFRDPDVGGTIRSENAQVDGYKLGTAEIRMEWKDEKLRVDEAVIRQNDGYLSLKGYLGLEDADMVVQASHFALNGLGISLGGVPLQGMLDFEGKIRGTIRNPQVNGDLSVDALNLGGIEFQHVEGAVGWSERTLSMAHLTAEQGQQHLVVQGNVVFDGPPRADLDLAMESTHLRDLMLVVGFRPRVPIDGEISGNLKLQGPLSDPQLHLKAALRNGYVQGYSQLAGQMDLEMVGKTINIQRLELSGPDGSLSAEGYYEPGKRGSLRINVDDFNLSPMVQGFNTKETVEGHLDLRADLQIGGEGIQGRISGRVRNGRWREILLPLTEMNGEIRDNMLSLNLEQKDIGLTLRGTGPIDPRWLRGIQLPDNRDNIGAPIHWELSAPQITGEMAKRIFPQVESAGGSVGLRLTVDGTWMSPVTTGEIGINHLNGKINLLPEAFSDISGKARINGNKLEILNLSAKYGKGKATVGGGLTLKGVIPDQLNLNIQIKNFHYKNPSFEGNINSQFTLSGTIHDPLVSGDAVVNRARIQITKGKRINRFNPRLDLNIQLGKDNYFHQPGLINVLINGSLKVGGTLIAPQMQGTITTSHGTVTVYGTTFRIVQASADFSAKEGVFPFLSGQAVTRTKEAEIRVFINGWSSRIVDLRFESTPPKTYEEILQMLHWTDLSGGGVSFLQGNMYSVMDSVLGSTLDQFRETLRMDFFDLEQEPLSGPLRLNMGKSVSDNLFITYSRALDTNGEDVWLVEYNLTPSISLEGDYSEEDGAEYRIDFRFRF